MKNFIAEGTVVTVTTNYENFGSRTVTGPILPRPRWLQADEIAIGNSQHLDGMSVINLKRVTQIVTATGQLLAVPNLNTADKNWTVAGSKGAVYTVTRRNNQIKCSCPGFQFRGRCRHIEEIQQC